MEKDLIPNEVKEKVFAQYVGQKVLHTGTDVVTLDKTWNWKHPSFKLILKPLSSITDEQAIDVYDILWPKSLPTENYEKIIDVKKWINNNGDSVRGIKSGMAYQYLQSLGYDLPNLFLDGKTLFEAGLAIYE